MREYILIAETHTFMQFDTIEISGFRSFSEKQDTQLESDLTTLVGPNEAGKSNLLQAISRISQDSSFTRQDESYLTPDSNSPSIRVHLNDISAEDFDDSPVYIQNYIGELMSYPGEYSQSCVIHLTKTDRSIWFTNPQSNLSGLYKDRKSEILDTIDSIQNRIRNAESSLENGLLPQKIQSHIANQEPEEISPNAILRFRENILDDDLNPDHYLRHHLSRLERLARIPESEILDSLSSPILISDLEPVSDEKELSELGEEGPYNQLLQFAQLEPRDFEELNPIQRRDIRELASKELSKQFNKYWRQEDIRFIIEFGNGTVSLLIANAEEYSEYDEINPVDLEYDLPSYRSQGFRYFLSFFIQVMANREENLNNNLILLDDPGIHLHPDAQKDLRMALERLAEDNQIVMTTHSPFLIDDEDLSEIRLVDKNGNGEGTKVYNKLSEYESNGDDALASVRAVIGAGFANSLFANKRNIVVEGRIDEDLLRDFSDYLDRNGHSPGLDMERTAMIDANSASKVVKYAKILDAEDYEYVCLYDADTEGSKQRDMALEDGIPEEHTHVVEESIEAFEEYNAELEDLCSRSLYFEAVVAAHDEISEDDLEEVDDTESRQTVNALNEVFGPMMGGIDKRATADQIGVWLEEDDEQIDEESLENFSTLIEDLNEKLEPNS